MLINKLRNVEINALHFNLISCSINHCFVWHSKIISDSWKPIKKWMNTSMCQNWHVIQVLLALQNRAAFYFSWMKPKRLHYVFWIWFDFFFLQLNLFWLNFVLVTTMDGKFPPGTRIYMNGDGSPSITFGDGTMIERKKTWSELKESVTELRKQLSKLSSMVPMNIQFRKLSDSRIRIYFLGTPPNGWETTLLCTDITPAMLSSNPTDEPSQQSSTKLVAINDCFCHWKHIKQTKSNWFDLIGLLFMI